MNNKKIVDLINALLPSVTQKRYEKMREVLEKRTRYVTVVLEDIYQPHNASAALRSCDSFGIQDMHVVEVKNKFSVVKTVAVGASQWLDVYRHKSIQECVQQLKRSGYRIVATTPHAKGTYLHELKLDQKIALLFGTEQYGLSKEAIEAADEYVTIPMHGFVESFNVSVTVALCLYDLVGRLRQFSVEWQLAEDEKNEILLKWLEMTVK